jgi:hypothetical protein
MTTQTKNSASDTLNNLIDALPAVVVLTLFVGGPVYLYHAHKRENARLFADAVATRDPWARYQELDNWLSDSWLSDEQQSVGRTRRDAALEEAVAAKDPAALQRLDEAGHYYPHLVDKYPHHPEQRESQLRGLRVLWPQLDAMSVTDRVSLLFMAEQCHLHEAPQPFARPTLLECVRTGARMLGDQQTLDRLLVSAVLGAPLIGAAR